MGIYKRSVGFVIQCDRTKNVQSIISSDADTESISNIYPQTLPCVFIRSLIGLKKPLNENKEQDQNR